MKVKSRDVDVYYLRQQIGIVVAGEEEGDVWFPGTEEEALLLCRRLEALGHNVNYAGTVNAPQKGGR